MTARFTLGKNERIKSQKLTDQVFREGKKFNCGRLRVHYLVTETGAAPLLFGVAVSVKQFSRAVTRNRVKRLVRESYRLQKHPLRQQAADAGIFLNVFFVFTGNEVAPYEVVFDDMSKALKKLMKTLNEKS